jgi:hypothetical protein
MEDRDEWIGGRPLLIIKIPQSHLIGIPSVDTWYLGSYFAVLKHPIIIQFKSYFSVLHQQPSDQL